MLFGGAKGAVVEAFAGQDIGHRLADPGGAVNVSRGVAGPHTEGGLSGAVRRPHQPRAAGGEDDGRQPVPHQLFGGLRRDCRKAGDRTFRGARFDRRLRQDPSAFTDAAHGARVGTHDDCVATFEGNQRLENGGRSRIRARDDRRDDARRHRDFHHAVFRILADDADGLQVLDAVINVARAEKVLLHLVRDDAVSGLFHRESGQGLGVLAGGFRHGRDDRINPFLGKSFEDFLGLGGLLEEPADFLDGLEVSIHTHSAIKRTMSSASMDSTMGVERADAPPPARVSEIVAAFGLKRDPMS